MSLPEGLSTTAVDAGDVTLSVLRLGAGGGRPVVMVHGLRDTAWSLLRVAQPLAQRGSEVFICELRGHGASSRSDAYGMPNFLLDLHSVMQQFAPQGANLFGHSLGGHIVAKYAALFPELTRSVILVEGLGPPRRPHEGDEAAELQAYRDMLLNRLTQRASRGRPIADIEDVIQRLCRNNPRLQPDHAREFAPHLVTEHNGTFRWAFDARANAVFIGSSRADNERFWRNVQAPTSIVSGALSYEYWGREMNAGQFAEGELESRAALFPNAEHHWFDQSGHMVHYDEPARLVDHYQQFLETNNV